MLPFINEMELVLRLGLAALSGFTFATVHGGVFTHKEHHLRLHILVCLGACMLVLCAGEEPNARSRAIAGVVTGVGFLGAGQILRVPSASKDHPQESIHGLTNAATVWFTAAIGVSIATSGLSIVVPALIIALVTLALLKPRQ
ncbi:MgtC/SapB family protein [bacterium]|nr:MgtC/SapB family protein [bacterium]